MEKRIAIAGAGISGLSSALMFAKDGYKVHVFAKKFSPHITSNRAAAFWFPYHVRNDKRGIDWCRSSYDFYKKLAENASTGISMKRLVKVLRKGVTEEEQNWIDFMPSGTCSILNEDEVEDNIAIAYEVLVPLIETQIFLPWLQETLKAKGVIFFEKEIEDLKLIAKDYDLLINCTGLGSQELCNDKEMYPVRGQVALIEPLENFDIYLDNEMPLYIVPRKDTIIIGGTYEEHIYDEITEEKTIEKLLQNAFNTFPELSKQNKKGSWAGLRPYRPVIRLEREEGTNIIHNYGHGGSGFTLAFGCAGEVLQIAEKF